MIMCYLASAQVNTLTGKQSQRHINQREQRDWSSEKGKLWFDYGSAPCKIWPRSWRQKLTPSLHKRLLRHELWQSCLRRVIIPTLCPHGGRMGWHNGRDAWGLWRNPVKLTAARANLHQRFMEHKTPQLCNWRWASHPLLRPQLFYMNHIKKEFGTTQGISSWQTAHKQWRLRHISPSCSFRVLSVSLFVSVSVSVSVCLFPS